MYVGKVRVLVLAQEAGSGTAENCAFANERGVDEVLILIIEDRGREAAAVGEFSTKARFNTIACFRLEVRIDDDFIAEGRIGEGLIGAVIGRHPEAVGILCKAGVFFGEGIGDAEFGRHRRLGHFADDGPTRVQEHLIGFRLHVVIVDAQRGHERQAINGDFVLHIDTGFGCVIVGKGLVREGFA